MNRSFFIVIAPARLVAAAYLGIYYGHVVPRWLAFSVAGAGVVVLLIRAVTRRGTPASAQSQDPPRD